MIRSAYIAVGYACNHRCVFCPCASDVSRRAALTRQEFQDCIDHIRAAGNIHTVVLSGGEPTMQPLLPDFLAILATTSMKAEILTNADRLSDARRVKRILDAIPPERVGITTALHSHDPVAHDRTTGSPGSWSRSVQGLRNAYRVGIGITVKHCITRLNYQALEDFVGFVYSEFPDDVNLLLCSIDYCGVSGSDREHVQIDFRSEGEYIERALDKVMAHGGDHRRSVAVSDTPLCCVDPFYWGFFTNAARLETPVYAAPTNGGAGRTALNVASDCGTFFEACQACDAEPLCSGAWRTARELLGEESVKAVTFRSEEQP